MDDDDPAGGAKFLSDIVQLIEPLAQQANAIQHFRRVRRHVRLNPFCVS